MATTKKNKFQTALEMSHKDIKGKRAAMFAIDAEEDSNELLRNLKLSKRNLERKLMNLEDFHADSTTTLKVTKDGFESKKWISEMYKTSVALATLEVEISIAESIHNKYFG